MAVAIEVRLPQSVRMMIVGDLTKTSVLILLIGCTACSATTRTSSDSLLERVRVTSRTALPWQPLNPARGDQSPRAANLWGDLRKNEATGFLVQFVPGFSSPPHIHNITYRGVVIEGLVHNDDPKADEKWMGPGSYWVQPAGDVHVTSAQSSGGMAYIEIDSGPYLVRPPDQAFESLDKPMNISAESIAWRANDAGFETVRPWGPAAEGQVDRVLVRLPAGFRAAVASAGTLQMVLIQGGLIHQPAGGKPQALAPGSALTSGSSVHHLDCGAERACVMYYRAHANVQIAAR